jgi:hypothetical protein
MDIRAEEGDKLATLLCHMPEHMKLKLLPSIEGCMARSSSGVLRVVDSLEESKGAGAGPPPFQSLHFDTYYKMGTSVSQSTSTSPSKAKVFTGKGCTYRYPSAFPREGWQN